MAWRKSAAAAAACHLSAASPLQKLALAPGLFYVPGYLDAAAQADLLAGLRAVIAVAPLFQPVMPKTGTPLSVRMTNCGPLGWLSDREGGYRYEPRHPETGAPWPAMPPPVEKAWRDLAGYERNAEACLINYYAPDARMGLHQDRDEQDFSAPVVSVSLGDSCVFRFGGPSRRGPTQSFKLHSGDAMVLGGPSRLAFHGVDRLLAGSSQLLAEGGRFNLTLRRVSR